MSATTPQGGKQELGTLPALALVSGSMLGIGIFIAPPEVARNLATVPQFLALWLAGGLAALFGALSVAELGAMMPRAGGDYSYLRLAYGPAFAFAAGWLQMLAIFPGSLATMAVGTATFQLPVVLGDAYRVPVDLLGLPVSPEVAWAVVIVLALTALNHVGIVISGRAQLVLVSIPVVVLLTVSLAVFSDVGLAGSGTPPVARPRVANLALAYLPVYFAYSGWNAAIFVGSEIRDPGRNIPRALVGGTTLVLVLYLVLCLGFLSVFTIEVLANAGEAGTAAARAVFGALGELGVTTLILLGMLGCMNGSVMQGSRIAYAMAEHGDAPRRAGVLHARFGTPVVALWAQAAWTVVLVSQQSFAELMNYTAAAMLITGTLTVLAVPVLRRKLPDRPRPYRTWMYPLPPLLYALSSLAVLVFLLIDRDPSVFLGGGWFLLALVGYRLILHRRRSASLRG